MSFPILRAGLRVLSRDHRSDPFLTSRQRSSAPAQSPSQSPTRVPHTHQPCSSPSDPRRCPFPACAVAITLVRAKPSSAPLRILVRPRCKGFIHYLRLLKGAIAPAHVLPYVIAIQEAHPDDYYHHLSGSRDRL